MVGGNSPKLTGVANGLLLVDHLMLYLGHQYWMNIVSNVRGG